MKICPKCKNTKELTEYGIDKKRKSGLNVYCKECIREIGRLRKIDYPERRCIHTPCQIWFKPKRKNQNCCCEDHSRKRSYFIYSKSGNRVVQKYLYKQKNKEKINLRRNKRMKAQRLYGNKWKYYINTI